MFNLPHKLDRKYQLETAKRIIEPSLPYMIVNAPTGSGKSAYAAYAANQGYRVLVLVKTKSLQRQYANGYGFASITGKGDYACCGYGQQYDFSGKVESLTADMCEVPKSYLKRCQNQCPYPQARKEFIDSMAGVTNYSKFMLDRKLIEDFNPDIIFLDEAHELGDNIVIDFSGISFNWKNKKLRQYTEPIQINAPQPIALAQGKEWLKSLYWSLRNSKPLHPSLGGDIYLYKWHRHKLDAVDLVLACMDIEPHCWFIRADKEGFMVKPLTSQFHFLRLFDKAPKLALMSATVQRQDVAALGLSGESEFIKVPNVIPAPMRPVVDLGGPAYTAKMTYQEKLEHAAIISKVFNDRPGWNGIIHTTSEKMALQLADMMKVDNPIWIPEKGTATDKSYADWQEFNNKNEGAICISWQFFAGVDMGDMAINITARMPYPYFGDDFEKERFNYHPGQARVRVANTFEQQQGRNRRGFSEHYGPLARKFNGIADGKWIKLKSAMQREFLESVI